MRHGRPTGTERRAADIVLAVLALGAVIAVIAIGQERQVALAETYLSSEVRQLTRHRPLVPDPRPIALDQPRRLLLLEAQSRLYEAPFAAPAARAAMLDSAHRALRVAAATPYGDGEAELALAYLHAGRGNAAAMRAALARSYAFAPYLRYAADWRVRQAFAHWRDLPSSARRRSVDEAIWYVRLRAEYREGIFSAARASPAYTRFLLALRQVRARDQDLRSFRGAGHRAP
ncbi:hypothetical protein [Sphingomonas sp.]|jgi:hypothetical protein|uniref:hypothetical protein n=1 Tax=Sphingomonas sp. TaxID=28214 RepID=UPI0035C87B5B